jgi:hypothetical protein
MHELVVGLVEVRQLVGEEGIPDHDTSKSGLVLVLIHHSLCRVGQKIAVAGGQRRAWQADEDFGILAGRVLEIGRPVVEVLGCVTHRVVVELDKESIKGAGVEDALHLEVSINQGALGRRREEILLGLVRGGQDTKPLGHGDITALVLWGLVLAPRRIG